MQILKILTELSLSFSLTTLALVSSAAGVQLQQLTPTNFRTTTEKGLWFLEHFSPYCPHCRNFAPTWEKLVEDCEKEIPSVHLAQIDCSIYGDLCDQNNIESYPTLLLFEDGKSIDKFLGSRDLDKMKQFLKRHAEEPKLEIEELPLPKLNVDGKVLPIHDLATFASTLHQGPTFVKFFAPWCGHCKKLAPTWVQLAAHLQNKVTVAEVDCDAHGALCATQKIQGYPTLVYFAGKVRSEYAGGRKLDQLRAFAEKAWDGGLHLLHSDAELDQHVREQDVVYLFLISSSNPEILKSAREASAHLLGSPSVYVSNSKGLFSRYGILSSDSWALLAFKDHNSDTPASRLHGTPSTPLDSMAPWFMSHRIPSFLELSAGSFQSVMNAPQEPLVLIAPVTDRLRSQTKSKLQELAKEWKSKTHGSGELNGKEVVFAWMDAETWKEWLKSMYGIKQHHDEDDLDDIKVVIADHKKLIYYDEDSGGHKIKLKSSQKLFSALEKATAGKLHYKHSQNSVERLAKYLNHHLAGVELYVTAHPYKSVFMIVGGIAVIFYLLFRWLANDVPHDRDYYKSARLD